MVAVDIINLKVCCCYQRDSRKRKASVLDNAVDNKPTVENDVIPEFDPRLDLARDVKPDKDGNYSFNVRPTCMLLSCFISIFSSGAGKIKGC